MKNSAFSFKNSCYSCYLQLYVFEKWRYMVLIGVLKTFERLFVAGSSGRGSTKAQERGGEHGGHG